MTRTAAAATITVGIITAAIRPAHAAATTPGLAPGANGPDGGAVPTPSDTLVFPPQPQPMLPPPVDVIGPLAAEIIAASSATERLGEQLKAIDDELTAARAVTSGLRTTWEQRTAELQAVRAKAAAIATDAYQKGLALGPFGEYANDLQNLGLIAPALPSQVEEAERPPQRDSIMYEVIDAERAEQDARVVLDAATAVENEIAARRTIINEQFTRHRAALTTLQSRNASLLGTLGTTRDAYEDSLSASRGLGTSINGLQAAPAAISAVNFALRQQGRPYEWAAEGPNSYDCSGLALASYLSVGIRLPRVSRYQYSAGMPVLVSQLLPGDLLFFSTDRYDWRQIHHVAIYIGNGRMVHAPTFGDVVRISPIWWTEYFGATRPIPATAVPGGIPTPTPSPTPTPTPTPTPSPTPSPTPTPTPTPTATASPTPTPTATASPTPTPTASPSPSASTSPSPTATASPTPTAKPSPTPVASPTPETTPTPTAEVTGLPAAIAASTPAVVRRSRRRRWWPRW